MPNLSYLITVHNEKTIKNLLDRLDHYIDTDNDEIIIVDDFSDDIEVKEILFQASKKDYIHVCQHALDKNYGAHKNWGTEKCKNPFIFQIDADEVPEITLLLNIKSIIEENPDIELYLVPRINDFRGVTQEHAKQWGWRLTTSATCNRRPVVNWPDYQSRIYKNEPSRIKWNRRLHEKIEGYTKFAPLPSDEEFALYHDKTIETQIKTNIRYNEWFTDEENRGHEGFINK